MSRIQRGRQPGSDNRHRDVNREIGRKYGNALILTLRKTYGPGFAPDWDGNSKLRDCHQEIDKRSLPQVGSRPALAMAAHSRHAILPETATVYGKTGALRVVIETLKNKYTTALTATAGS